MTIFFTTFLFQHVQHFFHENEKSTNNRLHLLRHLFNFKVLLKNKPLSYYLFIYLQVYKSILWPVWSDGIALRSLAKTSNITPSPQFTIRHINHRPSHL